MTESKRMWGLARRLAIYEARQNPTDSGKLIFPVSDKLRQHLVTLMGVGGFRALLLRAIALAATENPWLLLVNVEANGSLDWSSGSEATPSPEAFFEGRVLLVAELLGILEAFIGELLVLRIVRGTWPTVPLSDLDCGDGDKNEKQK